MPLVLIIGDFHIPHRASGLPKAFKKRLVPGKISHILCTGNLCTKDAMDYLKTLAPDVHVVQGDFDENGSLPEHKVIQLGNFRFGLCHGHQVVPWGDQEALAHLQRKLDVDVLVTGHTHQVATYSYQGKFFVNPGSATGAFTGLSSETPPSFVLMNVQDNLLVTYVYRHLDDEKVPVLRIDWTKGSDLVETPSAGAAPAASSSSQ
ncbi:MAG: vacuolar protein sorting-associated protein 29 [archaeon]|nr:vacuolar protein sorting-associated protein 29 [archaeon]